MVALAVILGNLAPCRANHIPQQHLAVFNRAAPEVVPVEVQQVEREIGKPVGSPLAYGIAQPVEMRNAAVIGDRDFAVQNHCRQPRIEHRPEWLPEAPGAVVPIAAEQHELAAVTRKNGD
jgi:hypothetical protein